MGSKSPLLVHPGGDKEGTHRSYQVYILKVTVSLLSIFYFQNPACYLYKHLISFLFTVNTSEHDNAGEEQTLQVKISWEEKKQNKDYPSYFLLCITRKNL